jgi:hypothetical protein
MQWMEAMTPDTIFSLAGAVAMGGWLVLIFGPRRFDWLNVVPLWVLPVALSALYAALILAFMGRGEGGFGSLDQVRLLFADDWVLLAGWVHYLAFDLFVGAVMAHRMDRVGVNRLVQAPILVAIFMLGPLGFLVAAVTESLLRLRHRRTQPESDAPHVDA